MFETSFRISDWQIGNCENFRYVLLQHHTSGAEFHWDFLFEEATALRTYSVAQTVVEEGLELGRFCETVLQRPDHRRIYLQYEGPVSNQRGVVRRIDTGRFVWNSEQEIQFQGNLCSGIVEVLENRAKIHCVIHDTTQR